MVGLLNLGVAYINSLVLFCYLCSALQANSLLDNRSHISNDYKRASSKKIWNVSSIECLQINNLLQDEKNNEHRFS